MRYFEEKPLKDCVLKPGELPCGCWDPENLGKTPDGTFWKKCRACDVLIASLGHANKPDGKPRPSLVDAGFIMAMAEVMEAGLKGERNREDWQRIERQQALEEYRDALLRHAFGQGPEDERQHLAAVACNAMILWWHLGRE